MRRTAGCVALLLVSSLVSTDAFIIDGVASMRAHFTSSPRKPMLLQASLAADEKKPAELLAALPDDSKPTPAWPCGDALDKRILALALPAVVNFLILPITGAVDLFWIGRLGNALASAGQAAADQVYSTAALLTNVIPIVTVPLIAKSYASGDEAETQRQVGGAIFLSVSLGVCVTLLVGLGGHRWLRLVGSPAAVGFALPYMRYRLPGVLPDALSTVGFSSFRGVMDTLTPLKVAAAASIVNFLLDPILMFSCHMGMAGAALATAAAQTVSGATYLTLLLRRRLVRWSSLLRPPSAQLVRNIAAAGGAVQVRNIALNVAFLAITKTTQSLDSTGVSAAAHAVTIALWQLGGVVLFAMGSVATILTSAEIGKKGSSAREARSVARRVLSWGAIAGGALGALQIAGLPLLGVFTPLPEVRRAAVVPSIIGAALQLINGIVFVGEGVMVASGAFSALAAGQVAATLSFLLALRLAPPSLVSVWMCFWLFNGVRLANFARFFWFSKSPLLPDGPPPRK